MHELGITENLLKLAVQHAEAADAARITRLNLVIGQFSAVVDDSIQFYWDMLARGTLAEGAELAFNRVPGKLVCADCGEIILFDDFGGVCPACGSTHVSVHDGSQFQLESIEVEGASAA